MPRRRRARLTRWVPWLVAAVALPVLAHHALDRAVDERLVVALENATGESITLEHFDVSLFGAVTFHGLALGDLLRVESLEARVGLSSLASGQVRADELVIEAPRANIRNGGARLQRVARRLASRQGVRSHDTNHDAHESADAWRRWPRVRLSGGFLRLDVGDGGVALIDQLHIRPTANGLRVVAGSAAYRGRVGADMVSIRAGRSAIDVDLSSAAITRAIAGGGQLDWRDGTIAADDLEVSYGIEAPGAIRAGAMVGGGQVVARATSSEAIELSFDRVAAVALSPLVPEGELDEGRVSGVVSLTRERSPSRATLTASGSIELHAVRGTLPWLFAGSLDLASTISGRATVSSVAASDDGEATHTLELDSVVLRRADLEVNLEGSLSRSGHGSLSVRIPETPCSALLASMPRELVGPLRGLRLHGRIAAAADLRIGQPGSRPVELSVDIEPSRCRVGADAPHANTAELARAHQHLLPSGRSVVLQPGSEGYVSLRALPSYVAAAFVTAEDGRFYQHHGFDHRQIESSIAKDVEVGRFARGGSTITQQLAKNLYLGRERTLGRKLAEAILAWRIEAVLSKRQILERYLNIIQLAENTYGIDAASRKWFGKSARRLTPREAAFLASLTRAPSSTTRAIRENGGITPIMVRRVEHILKSMSYAGAIDSRTLARERSSQLVLTPILATR